MQEGTGAVQRSRRTQPAGTALVLDRGVCWVTRWRCQANASRRILSDPGTSAQGLGLRMASRWPESSWRVAGVPLIHYYSSIIPFLLGRVCIPVCWIGNQDGGVIVIEGVPESRELGLRRSRIALGGRPLFKQPESLE